MTHQIPLDRDKVENQWSFPLIKSEHFLKCTVFKYILNVLLCSLDVIITEMVKPDPEKEKKKGVNG